MKATGNDDDSHGSIQDMERRFRAEEQQPYTVVVRYEDADQPDAVEPIQTFIEQVMAEDAHMAGRAAIDALLAERGIEADEEDPSLMDSWRVEYKCIAIYAGHLTNLVQ